MIKLIMFDLDGTLVDSSVDITNALNYAMSPYGTGTLTVEQTKALVGEGVSRLIGKVVGDRGGDIADDVLTRFVDFYDGHLTDVTRPYPMVAETLERLSGFRKAVVSNKVKAMSDKILADLGLSRHFDAVLGGDSLAKKKPSPAPLIYVMELFGFRPEECLMVGDSSFDIEAGRGAGILTVSVTYGFRPRESLLGSDFLIDGMEELPSIVNGLKT